MCNNYSNCHNTEIIRQDNNAIWVLCTECNEQKRIGLDTKGSPEHREYGEWFKRDIVQPDHPLYYKYAGAKGMNVV